MFTFARMFMKQKLNLTNSYKIFLTPVSFTRIKYLQLIWTPIGKYYTQLHVCAYPPSFLPTCYKKNKSSKKFNNLIEIEYKN